MIQGPRAADDALGGTTFWAAALNVYTPLPTARLRDIFQDSLRLHGFVSAGSVCTLTGGQSLRRMLSPLTRDVWASAGLGVALQSGPLQLELNYCFPFWYPGLSTLRAPSGLQVGIGFDFL